MLVSLFAAVSATAQWGGPRTPNDNLVSTEVLPGNKVAFRIYAPVAKDVRLGGDIMAWQMKFVKDARGV